MWRVYKKARHLARLVTWPLRRTVREIQRWRRGHIYGFCRPRWWPERVGWPGPRNPHANKSVVIFVGPQRYEFAPAVWGPYRGHVYPGAMRPDATDIAERLARLNLPTGPARALAVISGFEGGFDAIQTYDRGKFAWGFIQFTVTGGLPRLLQDLKALAPAVFDECFRTGGVDVDQGLIIVRVNGRTLRGRGAHDRLHDDPSLWTPFLRASWVPQVQDIQVKAAYDYYYTAPLNAVVTLGTRDVTLGALFAANEYGRAVVCDRAVNRGVGHVVVLFRSAVQYSGARSLEDASAILACVREIEAIDGWRLDALEEAIPQPRPG